MEKTAKVTRQLNTLVPYFSEGNFARLTPAWRLQNYRSPYSRLYYMLSGEILVESGGQTARLTPGHLYLIPPGLTFSAACPRAAEKYYFHVSLLKEDGYDLFMQLKKVVTLPLPAERNNQLHALFLDPAPLEALTLRAAVLTDLAALCRQEGIGTNAEPDYSQPVQETLNYIQGHLSIQLSVKELAAGLFLSESTLSHRFRQELGKTVGQYIDEMVCFEAQRRLLLTDDSMKQISEALGFCDQFYFSRRFREWTGKTPTAYRKEGRYK